MSNGDDGPLTVYGDLKSGNCYKIELLLQRLDRQYQWRQIDILAGAARTPEFLKKNPNGKVPILELADGCILCESNAILCYLATGTPLLPEAAFERARVMQWLFFEQHRHEPNVAEARFIIRFLNQGETEKDRLAEKHQAGYRALDVMEASLSARDFIAGAEYTVADIALYAYSHVADEGGFDLSGYPFIQRWFARIEAQPGYLSLEEARTRHGH